MSNSAEEEDPVFQELRPIRIDNRPPNEIDADINNMEGTDEVDEHVEARPGSSQSSDDFREVSQLSPQREAPDDFSAPCLKCFIYRDNNVKACDAASKMSNLQAQYNDLTNKFNNMAKSHKEAANHVEAIYMKFKESDALKDRYQGELNIAQTEIARLQNLNRQYLEAASLADKHRQAADDWAKKHVRSQSVLLEKSTRYNELEQKFKEVVEAMKKTVAEDKEWKNKLIGMKGKLDQKTAENNVMNKHWNTAVRLIADISRECCDDLSPSIRYRVNRVPIDKLLQVARPNADGTGSDDDEAEALIHLVHADLPSHETIKSMGPQKLRPRGGARFTGVHGGRGGRAQSMIARNVVDERMHDDMLARKLIRGDGPTSGPLESAAKSIMGKKAETVKEMQKKQMAAVGVKDKVAQMKLKNDIKNTGLPVRGSSSVVNGGSSEEDMMTSDDDDHGFDLSDADHDVAINNFKHDMDMPEIGSTREGNEKKKNMDDLCNSMYDSVKRRGRSNTPHPTSESSFESARCKRGSGSEGPSTSRSRSRIDDEEIPSSDEGIEEEEEPPKKKTALTKPPPAKNAKEPESGDDEEDDDEEEKEDDDDEEKEDDDEDDDEEDDE